MTLDLDAREIAILRQLLHFAVQAKGMEVAEPAVMLDYKLKAALRSAQSRGPVGGMDGVAKMTGT
jgi:hypothetical protein